MSILVGQRLFRVEPQHGSRPPWTYWIRVTKVGRRWAEFKRADGAYTSFGGRFDMETMRVDNRGFGDAGRVYGSEEEYQRTVRVNVLWRELRQKLDRMWNRPDKVDELAILKAADALGIKLEGE
jgi:hypothetical protein